MTDNMSFRKTETEKKYALVVDDGPVERLTGKALLEKLGFSAATAASGEEALQMLKQQPADLVLCDISMPGMSGLELLEATRAWAPAPLFIMVSSHDDAESTAACMRKGAFGCLPKPLRFEALREMVDKAGTHYPLG